MTTLLQLVRLARPWHWTKNTFVLMPVPFALAAGASLDGPAFALGLVAFCLANSAVYAFNDIRDAPQDREHPAKRQRPVASGAVSASTALIFAVLLVAGGTALIWRTGSETAVMIFIAYLLLNFAYSMGAKNVPLLDVFILSSGFVLRVLLGCALLAVAPSNWLLLCSSALALFLALTKRRADLVRGLGVEHRPSLAGYNLAYLDQAIGITAAMAVTAYGLYSVEASAVMVAGREFMPLLFVAYGVFEYLRLAHVDGAGGSPVEALFSSPTMLLAGFGWGVATLWSLGLF